MDDLTLNPDHNPFEGVSSDSLSAFQAEDSTTPTSSTHKDPIPTSHASPTLERTYPSSSPFKPGVAGPKTDYCCACDEILHSGEGIEIVISDAQKTSVNSSQPYISYVIKTGNRETYHRYSEFESLRSNLTKLYPTLIVPPIPDKQTLGDYAVKQTKAKEDAAMIARRKRMLQTFLNRIAKHPILSNDHVFHRFLDGEVSWTEVVNSPPISWLPKNILKAPSHNPTDQDAPPAYQALPNPSAAHPLRNHDQRFLDSEAFTNKFSTHLSGPMERVTRRTIKRWSEHAQDQSDLGAALNGFSLNESGELSSSIESIGQAMDVGYLATTRLLQDMDQNWSEPLHEYSQFATIIRKLLAYRHQKHVQFEMTQDSLESKREQLEDHERSEREADRLEAALAHGQTPRTATEATGSAEGEGGVPSAEPSADTSIPPHPGSNPARRRTRPPGSGLLNALSYTLHGMMDVDPESARRNGISKLRETISQLEDAIHLCAQDLKYSSSTIQADLDRFQRQKVADLREMTIQLAQAHKMWSQKNLEAWQNAKKVIGEINDHPNCVPEKPQSDTV